MSEHQALLFLPDALHDAGIPFGELTGWKSNQQGYYWTDPNGMHHGYLGDPNGHIHHHTATSAYTPVVRNGNGRTKANIYIGIWRNGRLWSFGNGSPLVVIASGGPANYSAGSGRRDVLTQYVVHDIRFPGPQKGLDDSHPSFFGNRYYLNTEVVHPGDGSAMDPDVWDLQVETAAVISNHYGWSHWRNIAHQDHTRRKVDQRVAQGAPYTIRQHQSEIRLAMVGAPPPPPPGQDPDDEYEDNMDTATWVRHLRELDIDRAVAAGSLPAGSADWWKTGSDDPNVPFQGLATPDDPEWEDYRGAITARRV